MTIRSKFIATSYRLLSYAELLKDMPQEILARSRADNLIEARPRGLQVGEQKFFRCPADRGGIASAYEVRACVVEQGDVPHVRKERGVMQRFVTGQLARYGSPKIRQTVTARRRDAQPARDARRHSAIALVRDNQTPLTSRLLEQPLIVPT